MANYSGQVRYLTPAEVHRVRQFAKARALQHQNTGNITCIRSWAILDTLLGSGLRASELASLQIADCLLGYGQASLLVRNGKGGRRGKCSFPRR